MIGTNAIELMYRELGIHPKNGKQLIAAGYVTVGDERLRSAELTREMSGKTLKVLGRAARIQLPAIRLEPPPTEQDELW